MGSKCPKVANGLTVLAVLFLVMFTMLEMLVRLVPLNVILNGIAVALASEVKSFLISKSPLLPHVPVALKVGTESMVMLRLAFEGEQDPVKA